jgi:tRNA(fMet)-specific endonuclease VapC
MTPLYMLDTNIVSDAIRNPYGRAAERMATMDDEMIAISAIVASELRFGAAKRGSARLTDLIEAVVGRIAVLPYEDVASHHFAEIRLSVERQGKPVGTTDLFIAAHARSLDLTLVTANTREFARIPGLKVENWLEDADDV